VKLVSIELYEGASIADALTDIAKTMRQGYEAGTLTNPRKHRNFLKEDFLGFWTAIPDTEQQCGATLLFEFGSGIDERDISTILDRLSDFVTAENGMVQRGRKVVSWQYRPERLLSRS
jgi:hypothetical protein